MNRLHSTRNGCGYDQDSNFCFGGLDLYHRWVPVLLRHRGCGEETWPRGAMEREERTAVQQHHYNKNACLLAETAPVILAKHAVGRDLSQNGYGMA